VLTDTVTDTAHTLPTTCRHCRHTTTRPFLLSTTTTTTTIYHPTTTTTCPLPLLSQPTRLFISSLSLSLSLPPPRARLSLSAYTAGLSVDQYVGIIGGLLSNVGKNLKSPHKFEAFHQAIRGPDFDFYQFGNDFVDTLMITEESTTEGADKLTKIDDLVAKGDNVILLANHQTEADPQILRLILENAGKDALAQKVIYVAGHKVTTDPLAIPFSMGCNLLCIHSKKHIANPPEETAEKQAQNMATMSKLQDLLKGGGQCVWVAPSGGRDRPVVEEDGSKEFQISSFDTKSVEMFRLIAQKAGKEAKKSGAEQTPTTHFFPLAMLTRKLVPPPDTTDSTVGEKRSAKRGTVGLAFGPEVTADSSKAVLSEDASKDEQRAAFATAAEISVKEMYAKLLKIETDKESSETTSGVVTEAKGLSKVEVDAYIAKVKADVDAVAKARVLA